jgi:hypothetical protein
MSNHLLLNGDKSEVILLGTATQLKATVTSDSLSKAGNLLPIADELKLPGMIINE